MNVEPWTTIGQGDSGPVVAGIQYLLRARGFGVDPDGIFGPQTRARVVDLQTTDGLPTDGIVGPVTWPKLVMQTGSGATGDAVRAVQQFRLLRSPGDTALTVDGEYGPRTEEHVEFFQESWGLTLDGIAGRETWSFLSTASPGPRPWPLVKEGFSQATNWRVLAAQHLLRAHGASIVPDGVFGPASGAAVSAYQQTLRASDISTTLGQLDWPAIVVEVRQGDEGEAVKALQTLLPGELAVDGGFGSMTDAAVREYQTMFAPPADGIVGPVTWQSLTLRIFD
ncbi:peptidoglycan-binding protein [Microbacterium sp. BK668]|uniref:peptidoglycan-binding domain-containing protein n=1 Tax=Microbacterium sp. BK668 TaxID=2512118 RepID=UPI0010DC959B|nr:peptidoglycan-binding protein [Microbacterium sp. BK668]TDN92606.1 peptidoglycan hydrolase-like protein with peptidoglycan-binding domain [Microbacterium sp. BK668]